MKTADKMIAVWDPVVRIGHWVLAAAFLIAYLTEDDFLTLHVWAGYVIGVVICVRLFWGFVGSRHARFSDFVRSPAATRRYLGDLSRNRAERYLGHNPAGAAMVLALLVCLSLTVVSGLAVYALEEGGGPLAGWVGDVSSGSGPAAHNSGAMDDEESVWEDFWEETHELCANLTLLLVALHVAGVLFSSYSHGENLIRGMITGRKRE